MVDQSIENAERVSALVDGQLQGDEFAQTLADLTSNRLDRSNWDTYHLVGDVMRSGNAQVRAHDADFVRRLRQRMELDAIEMVAVPAIPVTLGEQKKLKSVSANEGSWRRVAGFASVAVVGVLAWQGLHWGSASDPTAAPQLAQQAVAPLVPSPPSTASTGVSPATVGPALIRNDGTSALALVSEPAVMIRDPQLDALLAAHRQFGGASALQTSAGFLRNATFEEGHR